MSVAVDVQAIERLWAGQGNHEHVWLLMPGFEASDPRNHLAAVIEKTNDAMASWLDDDLHPTWGRPPVPTEAGAVWEVECFHREGPSRWVTELSRRLEESGLSGEIRARPYPKVGQFDAPEGGQVGRSAAVVLAPSGWAVDTRKVVFGEVRHVPEHRGVVVPSWKVDHGQVPDLIELVMDFFGDEPSRLLLNVGIHSDVSRRSLGPLLSEALKTPRGEEPLVDVKQFGQSVNRSVSFDDRGRVLLTTVAAEDSLLEHIHRACDLAVPWAQRCDWVLLMENSLAPTYDDSYLNARGTELPREIARTRLHDDDPLPDAFPWAVLSAAQLPPSLDSDRWEVTPLAHDRFLVTSNDLSAWFTGPEALQQARRDWAISRESV